jgi:GAF domain-containing protein
MGSIAVHMSSGGTIPGSFSKMHILDEGSPVAAALQMRQPVSMPDARVFPVEMGDEAIAALIAYLTQPSELLDTLLKAVAAQLGPAIAQGAQSSPGPKTGRLTRQVDMMRSLYEVTKNVSSALDSQEVLHRAARSLVETLEIDHVSVVVFDYAKRSGNVVSEYPDSGMVGGQIPIIDALYDRFQRERSPIIISNVDDIAQLGQFKRMEGLSFRSAAFLPMLFQASLIGAVALEVYYDVHEFGLEEIEAAVTITSQLAISVRNAQLYDEIRRRATQLERISELGRRMTSTFDRGQIFQIVKEETHSLIEAHLVSVALKSSNSPTLELCVLGTGEPAIHEFEAERTALQAVINKAKGLVLDDLSAFAYPDYQLLARANMRALMTVPLLAGGQVIGTYNVAHQQPNYYSPVDLAVLEQIGSQLAVALENARIYDQASRRAETERLINRLSGSIQGRGDLHGMLLASIQEIADALSAKRARVRLQMSTPSADEATRPSPPAEIAARLIDRLSNNYEG